MFAQFSPHLLHPCSLLWKGEVWCFKIWFNPPFLLKCLHQVRVITVFTVFRLLTDFVCLYTYEFWLSLCKIARSSVICYYPYLLNCILCLRCTSISLIFLFRLYETIGSSLKTFFILSDLYKVFIFFLTIVWISGRALEYVKTSSTRLFCFLVLYCLFLACQLFLIDF